MHVSLSAFDARLHEGFLFTFSKFMLFKVASIDLTTPAIDFVTWNEAKEMYYTERKINSFLPSSLISVQLLQYQIAGHMLLPSHIPLCKGSYHLKFYKFTHLLEICILNRNSLKTKIYMALTFEGPKTCHMVRDIIGTQIIWQNSLSGCRAVQQGTLTDYLS